MTPQCFVAHSLGDGPPRRLVVQAQRRAPPHDHRTIVTVMMLNTDQRPGMVVLSPFDARRMAAALQAAADLTGPPAAAEATPS